MPTKEIEEFQKQTLDMLRAQQEAYLKAVKSWRDAMGAATPAAPPAATPPASPDLDNLPTPSEMAEAGYAFASKLLADQSRFLEELGRTMMIPKGPGKPNPGA